MAKRRQRASAARAASGKRARAAEKAGPESELDLLKQLWNFGARQRATTETSKVLQAALKLGSEFFSASDACVAVLRPGLAEAEIRFSSPADSRWDRGLLAGLLQGFDVTIPPDLMLARIRRYDRLWGALALRCRGRELHFETRKAFSSIGVVATQLIERIDELRVREVRRRIDHKILEQIGPKDLFYQILHGIRSLIAYDHSAALLTYDADGKGLEIVGEQIAWRKAKSQMVGHKLPLTPEIARLLEGHVVYGFHRDGRSWRDWTETEAAPLAQLLDYNRDESALTSEGTMLCAPLITRHGPVGLLKVASLHAGALDAYEADIISQFLPHVALALRNMRRTESLEQRMRAAERKQAMSDLARAVSHDVNNAIGAVVPLVQQMQVDLGGERVPLDVFREDLQEVERSMQICRRIFGGMLGFARGASRNSSDVYLKHEIDCTLAVFKEGFQRRGVEILVDVPDHLPPLVGIQADIDQLLLNLIGNARDAMESGGSLTIRAANVDNRIELEIADSGRGIPPEDMAKILEPFFTTKASGNGLGLSICRSIVSQMRGKMRVESKVGAGTTVRISLPVPQESEP